MSCNAVYLQVILALQSFIKPTLYTRIFMYLMRNIQYIGAQILLKIATIRAVSSIGTALKTKVFFAV